MGTIEKIVLHCSDSEFGTAVEIDRWHRGRKPPFKMIGYMGVILNGYPIPGVYWEPSDGAWEWGRPVDHDNIIEPNEVGAHAFGINAKSVGICMIGKEKFSYHQFHAARRFILALVAKWKLSLKDVIGHYEVDKGKTCPNINMDTFRLFLTDVNLIDELMVGK